jgi:hypothetical protein
MLRRLLTATGGIALAATALLADFSYQETSKITGGAVVNMMQFAGTFSKNARQAMEPQQSSVAIKGDRMVHRNDKFITIIDVNAETITHVDMDKKQYSVMTFAQLKQMLDDMAKKMKQGDNSQQLNYKLSVDNTGKTRQINGLDCKELVMKMEMEGTDAKTGQKGNMVVNIDTWVAPGVPGYEEAKDFYKKMAEKIAWAPGSSGFMAQPNIMQGMAAAQKELAKLDGVAVLRVMNMGAEGTVPPQAPAEGADPMQKQQPQQEKPSVSGALGSALGGRFGLGRKKPKDDSSSSAPAASSSSSGGSASGVLMEMTMESTGFSSAPVDASLFQIPTGFKQVEPEMGKSRR